MDDYSKRWPLRLRGPYETGDGIRYVVAPNRNGVTLLCPMCSAHVHPGQLVATIEGLEPICMECRPPGGSRIRAGRQYRAAPVKFLGFASEGEVTLWQMLAGKVWAYGRGQGPSERMLDEGERIGDLRKVGGFWFGSLVYRKTIGEVEILVPVKIENAVALTMLPGKLYLDDATNHLVRLRLTDQAEFNKMQRAAKMRLWAWNRRAR